MVRLRGAGADPVHQQRPVHLLARVAFGVHGASYFLGVSEWLFGALLLAGFWSRALGILGAIGSTGTFVMTVTIIPFMPDGWAAVGFPAMAINNAFLLKDVVLLAVSLSLLKEDLRRVALTARP